MIRDSFGKYSVTQQLGRGGMAEVYQAYDPILERQVAIKVILPHLTAEADFAARFLREARLVASLRHPHIVQLFDFAVLDDQPYMVMEYLAGGTLQTQLRSLRARGATMPLPDIVHLLEALASALGYAHELGAIHRDIKPANILFTTQGEPVLTDFGIARLLDQAVHLSLTGAILGTPAYISPEQAAGRQVDARSDLYSLGVVLYELATGRTPFQGDSASALLMQQIMAAPPAPRRVNPTLSAAVEQVLFQALAKEPENRFASPQALAQAFRAAAYGENPLAASPEDPTMMTKGGPALAHPQPPPVTPPIQEHSFEMAATSSLFVARERELAQLQQFFNQALNGRGQVCFVTGEAGTGKTALVTELGRLGRSQHPEVVVAAGNCNTQSGAGDPYLPFRELLRQLLGLVEQGGSDAATVSEAVSQPMLRLGAPGRALVDHGPDLIDIFVPGSELMAQMAAAPTQHSLWLERLQKLVQRKMQSSGVEAGVEQHQILEQYTNVLLALAAQRPLMLVVDDLQWVDVASAQLLFHLSRRLGESRILLVGTYRPDEVVLGRNGEEHPLHKVVAEIKRYFGDVQIPLGQEEAAARRRFVDSLIDSEPNLLSEPFRQALLRHTGGHALFTVELLRALQERGNLTRDDSGKWVEGAQLDWGALPPRVEGVIEERIGRLAEELREVLTIASIEGEDFTAEVVAQIQQVEVRGLIRQLSRELAQQHRLVGAIGRQQVGQQQLSIFRFQHNLFQKYLYDTLNPVERAYFHQDVGTALEGLYGEGAETIAVQLAWHFSEADLPEKARPYLARAGEQAHARYAHAEALSYFNRALALTPPSDHAERYTLFLARQNVYDVLGERAAQAQDLAQLEALAQQSNDPRQQAEVALYQAGYSDRLGDYSKSAEYAQKAVDLAVSGQDVAQQAKGYHRWGRALLNLSDYAAAQPRLEDALALAEAGSLAQIKADCLRSLGVIAYFLGHLDRSQEIYLQALTIYRKIGDRRSEAHTLGNLGLANREQGNYTDARNYLDQALAIHQEIGDRDGEAYIRNNLGLLSRDQGDLAASRAFYEQALEISRQTGGRAGEALALLGIGDTYKDQDLFTDAAPCFEAARRIFHESGDRRMEYLARKELGGLALYQGDYDTAHDHYAAALHSFRQIGDRQSESSTLNRLGLLYRQMGKMEAAYTNSQGALDIAQEIGDRWLVSSSLTKMGHALSGLGRSDEAAGCYQKAVALWRELGRPDLALESVAGLARLALGRGDLAQAQAYAQEMLRQFAEDGFSNAQMAEEYLSCYQALQANGDGRAREILQAVYNQVQTTAAQIGDPILRSMFLENVPTHQEIIQAWEGITNEFNAD